MALLCGLTAPPTARKERSPRVSIDPQDLSSYLSDSGHCQGPFSLKIETNIVLVNERLQFSLEVSVLMVTF